MSSKWINDLWNYQAPAESEARFRTALAKTEAGSERWLELMTQIARAQGLQYNFAAAHATLDEVQQALDPAQRRATIRYWLERGRVHNSSGQPAQASSFFRQAWEAAQAVGEDFLAVDAAHMLGIVEPSEERLAWNLQALALAEASADPEARQWLGSLYNNIGWTYHDLGRDGEALAIFEKALAWREAAGQPTETRIARWCVARILRTLNRVQEALVIQQQLRQQLAVSGETDGYVDEELGECLLVLGRPTDAAPHFARAHELLSQDPWLVANEPARLARLQALGSGCEFGRG
jgi:tetratricopeptide (TPR) repeat protein